MNRSIKRREFLKKSSLAMMGWTIMPSYLAGVPPSDRVRIAHIGVGDMGNNHMKWFASIPDVDIVALCDVDQNHLENTLLVLNRLRPDVKVKTYTDFRHILDRRDIDAITCATPDHWHAQIASLAFQAEKDVYGEKPLSYDIAEGKMMLDYLNRHNRIFQLGTQIHATDNYHRIVELIQSGVIGKVHTIRLWKNSFSPGLGNPEKTKPPKSLDWDMWLGPAPYVAYIPERCHKTYRYFLDYSGGVYADFWCHIADIAFWSVNPEGLYTIESNGDVPDGIADAPEWLNVAFKFRNLDMFWTTEPPDVPGAKDMSIGAFFEGEKGSLICDYNTRKLFIEGKVFSDIPEIEKTLDRSPGHQQNFVNSVKSRLQPESNLSYVRKMTLPMHLGLISWRVGRKLEWDALNEKFINDIAANEFLKREYRKKWNLIGF